MLRLNDFKIFCICLPQCNAGASIQRTQWEGCSLWGSPRASLYYLLVPHWDSIPGTAPVQPQSIFGGIIRDLIAASSAQGALSPQCSRVTFCLH